MANRLVTATSPYLLQHAENPVDWYEWSDEAFEESRRRDVPVLLSVGYAACHWCHVMAHESFEDPDTAAYLNEHFVSIKVDREERPDVDAIYMAATQAMTGQGGWPMTCALTPDGEPYFAGTYFPAEPRQGMPAFRQVLEALVGAWRDKREQIATIGSEIVGHLRTAMQASGASIGADELDSAVRALAGQYDGEAGGFAGSPKFPPSMVLEFLLRYAKRTGSSDALAMVEHTCEAMARGGMYDQIGGGFARYSVDRYWRVPHFEKMLYDNALLLRLYAHWWRQTGSALAERVVGETAEFLLRELGTEEGGFASALDADTDGVEGTYYVWDRFQLTEALGEDDAGWAAGLLDVTEQGTFERGYSTLLLQVDPGDTKRWEHVRTRLAEVRDQRTRPARDDKIVAAWNGLAITALVEAGIMFDQPRWTEAGVRAAELLATTHTPRPGRLVRTSREGRASENAGVLDDYGCVAEAYLSVLGATGDARWLHRAEELLDTVLAQFRDDDGVLYDTAADASALVARPRDPGDNASPSGTSAAAEAFVACAA
ncbi:MAG: thioredoxin domain-containing protein, partial [Actinomycetia bacterium]|nr:thioredoxin domain-containing protein [Actinomycetes bacterium]